MTTEEVAGLDGARAIAVLPVAAIEQHGPHLPLSVDADIAEGVLARAVALAPPALPFTVLPMLPVGKSNEHEAFPGTLSLSTETAVLLWTEVALNLARWGLSKLVLFNSHGGQSQIADLVARDLRAEAGMLVVAFNCYRFFDPADLFDAAEVRDGIHAGAIETSVMLHLKPESVRRDRLGDFSPVSGAPGGAGRGFGPGARAPVGWQAQDLHPAGAVGNALLADAELGRIMVDRAARALLQVLEELDATALDALKDRD